MHIGGLLTVVVASVAAFAYAAEAQAAGGEEYFALGAVLPALGGDMYGVADDNKDKKKDVEAIVSSDKDVSEQDSRGRDECRRGGRTWPRCRDECRPGGREWPRCRRECRPGSRFWPRCRDFV